MMYTCMGRCSLVPRPPHEVGYIMQLLLWNLCMAYIHMCSVPLWGCSPFAMFSSFDVVVLFSLISTATINSPLLCPEGNTLWVCECNCKRQAFLLDCSYTCWLASLLLWMLRPALVVVWTSPNILTPDLLGSENMLGVGVDIAFLLLLLTVRL